MLVASRWNRGIRRLILFSPLIAYPLLTVVSTLWSLAPAITLRYSLQLLFTAYVGLYLGLYRRPSDIVKVVFLSTSLGFLLSVASDQQGQSANGMVLVGLVGSKNAMAFLAQWTALSALAMLVMPKTSPIYRLAGLLMLAPASYVALHVQATAAALSLFAGFALFIALYALARMPAAIRYVTAGVLVGSVLAALLLKDLWIPSAEDFLIRVLHKDLTFTGRTVLWDHAREFMARRPLLGRGYKEIWSGGSVDTQGLLRFAKIIDGRGFYFHETYLDAGVDCGLIGVAVLVLSFTIIAVGLGWRYLQRPSVSLAYFLTMDGLLMLRSFGETLMQPLSPYCVLLFCIGVVALAGGPVFRTASSPPRRPVARRAVPSPHPVANLSGPCGA